MNQHLIRVQVLNKYESQIDFKPKEEMTVIARQLDRITEWEGVKVEITCTAAPKDKVEVVVKDCETTRCKSALLERESRSQKEYQAAIEQLLRSVNRRLEEIRQSATKYRGNRGTQLSTG